MGSLHLRKLSRSVVPTLTLFACIVLVIVDVVLLNHDGYLLLLAGRRLKLTKSIEVVRAR